MNEENYKQVKESLSRGRRVTPLEQVKPSQQEIDELFHERITPETDLPPMQPLFKMFEVPCFYRGELVADCGKAKSGKTFFLSILMAACLTQKALALERIVHTDLTDLTDCKPLRVLWIDTEQSQQSTQEILKDRTLGMADPMDLPADVGLPKNAIVGREYVTGRKFEPGDRVGGLADVMSLDMRPIEEKQADNSRGSGTVTITPVVESGK